MPKKVCSGAGFSPKQGFGQNLLKQLFLEFVEISSLQGRCIHLPNGLTDLYLILLHWLIVNLLAHPNYRVIRSLIARISTSKIKWVLKAVMQLIMRMDMPSSMFP
jgi:hypothetical protein